ncbi:MAG: CDP-2,3-bis-(O-geranylgeranyl)-sn-glycerol synthase [Candidatus ainarchaeum sp.]|nr:CDP-2,3-bis-(O-geranylgeranyl)-sn-glycerol synthase [Candidatus ainarchaeum sp.]
MIEGLLGLLVFILPAYVANSAPVLFGGGTPMDFGGNAWDGRRALGDGKTWRGFVSGIAFGILAGAAVAYAASEPAYMRLGVLLAFGAMVGDLAGSFAKRRIGMGRGQSAFLLDQLPFLAFALIFASPIYLPPPLDLALLALLTYVLHVCSNFAANRLGLKSVPW